MKFMRSSSALILAVVLCHFAANVSAQDVNSKSRKANATVTIAKAELAVLGRIETGPSIFVAHALSYCLRGTGTTLIGTRGLQVRFVSNKLTKSLLDADSLIKGSLVQIQEPLDGTKERCGTIEFAVNADAMVGLELTNGSSNSRLLLETGDGSVISSEPVQPKRVSAP